MPGHAIPEPYRWDESFCTFYKTLDEEHKGLFDGIFDCAADRASANKLGSLASKVKAHFATEEAMMQSKGYSEFPGHKKLHDAFVADLGKLKAPLDDAAINFAKDWLVQHIKDTDFKYKGKLD
jgi:hemerythrin family non-heme iron protein